MWRESSAAAGDDDSPCQSSFRSRRVRTRVTKPESRMQRGGALGRTPQARFRDPLGSAASSLADPSGSRKNSPPPPGLPPHHYGAYRAATTAAPPPRGSGVDLRPRPAAHAPATQASRSPSVTVTGIRVCAGRLPDARSSGESGPREKDDPRLCARMPAGDSSTAAANPWKRFWIGETAFAPGRRNPGGRRRFDDLSFVHDHDPVGHLAGETRLRPSRCRRTTEVALRDLPVVNFLRSRSSFLRQLL